MKLSDVADRLNLGFELTALIKIANDIAAPDKLALDVDPRGGGPARIDLDPRGSQGRRAR